MKRKFWKNRTFERKNPTQYPCPKCYIGVLKPKWLKKQITIEAKNLSAHGYPYGIKHIFSGIYECSRASCCELVSFGGVCYEDIEEIDKLPNGEFTTKYNTVYQPKYFYPNLRLFELPSEIPTEIREVIDLSFSHYFNDLSSCANRIRTAIELILDEIKAPKYKITKSKKRHVFRSLHERIENFKRKKRTAAELLLAIKFIGNEGSHIGKVEIEDILDAYQILTEVIDIAFVNKRKKIVQIAHEINHLREPRSKK